MRDEPAEQLQERPRRAVREVRPEERRHPEPLDRDQQALHPDDLGELQPEAAGRRDTRHEVPRQPAAHPGNLIAIKIVKADKPIESQITVRKTVGAAQSSSSFRVLPSLDSFVQQIIVTLKVVFKGKLVVLTPSISLAAKNKKQPLLDDMFYRRFVEE